MVLRATSPSLGSRVLPSSSLPQREGRVHPPYILAFKCERRWGLEFTFGTNFTLSPGPERRGNAFSPQPRTQILSFPVLGPASPRTFDRGAAHPAPPVRAAPSSWLVGWALGRSSASWHTWRAWRASKCSPFDSPQRQVKLLAARNVRMQLRVAAQVPLGIMCGHLLDSFAGKKDSSDLGVDLTIDRSLWTRTDTAL